MFLLIDKPKGVTSHDVVDKVREITGEKKVGHGGTLDPNATGLLIIGIGRESTRKLGKVIKETKKVYEAEIFLGEERDTDDAEGVVISRAKGFLPPGKNEIGKLLTSFIGEQTQVPPAYSALKIRGKKAYELARKGEKVSLKKRRIVIHSIELVDYEYPILKIKTTVSSGTYIRSLALDIGRRIGSGAYLKNLRRTKIGKFDVKDAVKLDNLSKNNLGNFVIEID